MVQTLNELIRKAYYDPKIGLQSADKLYRKLKVKTPKITLKLVKEFINKQAVAQIHQQKVKPEFNQIMAFGLGELQIDLLDLSHYARENKTY